MSRTPSVLGVADHTGWAHVVCVSARDRRPFVVSRRRIALIDRGLPTLPYEHETRARRPDEAQALVASVRKSIAFNTDRAVRRLVDELSREHPVRTLTIRTPPLPKLPASVAEVHASHRLLRARRRSPLRLLEQHGRFTLSQLSGAPTWSHPIVAAGLLIVRDQDNVYSYDLRAR